jgi:RHS repeat-associated protein
MLDKEPTIEGKSIHFYHCDHLGTPMALINQQGEIDWSIELDPWGNTIREHNPKNMSQPIRLQGQHFDEESGLHYNRHRYYDPRTGRYINQDPVGIKGDLNLYLYPTSPLSLLDPLGLQGGEGDIPGVSLPEPAPTVDLRPDGRPWGAGCGDAKTDRFVPDSYFGIVDFTKACEKHDDCYGTWGAVKETCDANLRDNMIAACNEADEKGKIGLPALCRLQGRAYKFVLDDLGMGQSAFDAAQEEAFWKMIDGKMQNEP